MKIHLCGRGRSVGTCDHSGTLEPPVFLNYTALAPPINTGYSSCLLIFPC